MGGPRAMEKPAWMVAAMPQYYVGTAGWHYPAEREGPLAWDGVFYPRPEPGKKPLPELEHYARFFNTAEVNLTFYKIPHLGMIKGWVRRTAKDFRFSIKLHQKFTHPSLYEQSTFASGRVPSPASQQDIDAFRTMLQVLADGGRLGCQLMQFGYDLPPTPENIERIGDLAKAFEPYPVAFEVRTGGWRSSQEIVAKLEDWNVAGVYADQYTLHYPTIRDVSPPSSAYYLRLHGRSEKWV